MSMNMLSSEIELGKFLGSIEVTPYAFRAISETSSAYKLHTSSTGIKVLAFSCLPDYTTRFLKEEFEFDKVSDFILDSKVWSSFSIKKATAEVKPSFSLNKAAIELFESLSNDLKALKTELIKHPLVVTGQGLGGYRAILFAMWLHKVVDVEESNDNWTSKRPICITFGSPLVGDEDLQLSICKCPQWESRFLNVVMEDDGFASFFSLDSNYRPFGTFLFSTKSGAFAAFRDPELVLDVLDKMRSSRSQTMEPHDYGNLFSVIRRKSLYRGVSESTECNKEEYFDNLVVRMEGILTMRKNNRNPYEPTKKLNDMKKSMLNIEMYMHKLKYRGGIYDFYKNKFKNKDDTTIQYQIMHHQRKLTIYWKRFVEETNKKPQKEDAKMRKRWLYNCHNYRRMVEPLDIAEYYKKGNCGYMAQRSNHYITLEELLTEGFDPSNVIQATSLTKDSCFWAHVEEGLISLEKLKKDDPDQNVAKINKELEGFEDDVMNAVKDLTVSPDIFLKGSSFMKWWDGYKAYKGSSYTSQLAHFMNNKKYISYG